MISFVCPRCKAGLNQTAPDELRCSQDGLTFYKVDGIWRFLLPERVEYYARFVRDYETVRRFEGRGSADESYYRTLPYHASSDWKIRATSFNAFVEQVIIPFEKNKSRTFAWNAKSPDFASKSGDFGLHRAKVLKRYLQILDLGAGNGWLSNQLASRGHALVAVDLTINDFDGLGCHRFYDSMFLSTQAEFDCLPFPDKSFDIVLFNASLHYSVNYEQTLNEAQRVLDVDGKLIVLDSPVYHDAGSGQSMVKEREEQFTKRYGFASDSLQSENYLTYQRMDELAAKLGITWRHIRPFYGIRWALHPWLARLRGRREPAEFGLWVGSR